MEDFRRKYEHCKESDYHCQVTVSSSDIDIKTINYSSKSCYCRIKNETVRLKIRILDKFSTTKSMVHTYFENEPDRIWINRPAKWTVEILGDTISVDVSKPRDFSTDGVMDWVWVTIFTTTLSDPDLFEKIQQIINKVDSGDDTQEQRKTGA